MQRAAPDLYFDTIHSGRRALTFDVRISTIMKIITSCSKRVYRSADKTLKLANRIISTVEGSLLGNKITAYWYTGEVNFGDLITPDLLKLYGFTPVHYPVEQAQLLSTGSILHLAPEDYSGHIVGSGLIKDTSLRLKKAKVWAVRGELTRERLAAPKSTVLGDPGLLSLKLLKQRQKRRYTLGIVPHFVDKKDTRISMIEQRYKDDILVIDVMRKPSAVFEDIDKCDFIISSSLHGIIVADSLNIPNAWIYLSDKVLGKGFKFHDYFSAIGRSHNPLYLDGSESLSQLLKYCQKPPGTIEEVMGNLDSTFRSLKNHFDSE